jgi:hypothetical protein
MIKTSYDLEINIDSEKFKITLSEPTAAQKKEMKSLGDEKIAVYEKRNSLTNSLLEKKEEFELNKLLIKESGILDKVKLLLEQKSLNSEIYSLKREIQVCDKDVSSMDEALDIMLERRFDLLVGGEDKTTLKGVIKTKGVDYRTLFDAFAVQVKESREKK